MPSRLALAIVAAALLAPAPAAGQVIGEPDPEIVDGSAQKALDAARKRWRAFGVRSYRFRVQLLCFCSNRHTAPVVIEVRRGRAVDPPRHLRDVATVPRLHRTVQQAIDDRVEGLSVRYGRRGVPRSISIDPSRMIADEQFGYSVGRVRPRG